MRIKRFFLFVFLMVALCLVSPIGVMAEGETDAEAGQAEATTTRKDVIYNYCNTIRDHLKLVQKQDARARVYLGGYYETILSKYMIPLNVRLVENSLAEVALTENQNDFTAAKKAFSEDYINYQQRLEELTLMDCRADSEAFYNKLLSVREKRQKVNKDVQKMRSLMDKHIKLVEGLKVQ